MICKFTPKIPIEQEIMKINKLSSFHLENTWSIILTTDNSRKQSINANVKKKKSLRGHNWVHFVHRL